MCQSLKGADAENIGYVIPTTVIHHFLSDYDKNGRYTGTPQVKEKFKLLCILYLLRFKNSNDVAPETWSLDDFAWFPGFPSLGVMWQKLENPALRAFLQMQPDQRVTIRTFSVLV